MRYIIKWCSYGKINDIGKNVVDDTFIHIELRVNEDDEGKSSKIIKMEIIDQIKILNPCQLNLLEKHKFSRHTVRTLKSVKQVIHM